MASNSSDGDDDVEFQIAFGETSVLDRGCYKNSDSYWKALVSRRRHDIMKFGIDDTCRFKIQKIKNNDPTLTDFSMNYLMNDHPRQLLDSAWGLLGRYIAANDHLVYFDLSYLDLTDATFSILFKHLTKSTSLKALSLSKRFGLNGIQSMVPFLKNASNLTKLSINRNENLNTECFRLLIEALDGGPIQELNCNKCSSEGCSIIDDSLVLEHYDLPHLQHLQLCSNNIHTLPLLGNFTRLEKLWLQDNDIGKDGCRSIANLLKSGGSSLRELHLALNKIGDEEGEMLAESLEQNTTLETLMLENNENVFREGGCRAFLKLVNDISSIERTYSSNHTLRTLGLPCLDNSYSEASKIKQMKDRIYAAVHLNDRYQSCPLAVGREKVIKTQLYTRERKELCHFQGIDFSYSSPFVGMDANLSPNILEFLGNNYDDIESCREWSNRYLPETEYYRMVVALAPDLTSLINRKIMLEDTMAKNRAQITDLAAEHSKQTMEYTRHTSQFLQRTAALTAENCNMNNRLLLMGAGEKYKATVVKKRSDTKLCGKRRRRSASI